MHLVGSGIEDLNLGGLNLDQIDLVCAVDFSLFLSAFRSLQEQTHEVRGFARFVVGPPRRLAAVVASAQAHQLLVMGISTHHCSTVTNTHHTLSTARAPPRLVQSPSVIRW